MSQPYTLYTIILINQLTLLCTHIIQTLFGHSNRIIVYLHNQQHYMYHLAINTNPVSKVSANRFGHVRMGVSEMKMTADAWRQTNKQFVDKQTNKMGVG